jgi:hypothetical protein
MDMLLKWVSDFSVIIFSTLGIALLLGLGFKTIVIEFHSLRKMVAYLGNVDTERTSQQDRRPKK